jgi:3'-phosphoadenosine 5'-phosphosulfate sulfotransferase (PAPS reductase)/FAD synthetase
MINKTAIVLYSGGKGSFLAAYLAKQIYSNTVLYFNDTKTEDEDLYRFLYETVAWLGLPLFEDSDGRDIWQVFNDRKYLGNTRLDPCSEILKRNRSQRWVRQNFPDPTTTDIVLGMGLFEEHRITKAQPHWQPYTLVCPLASVDLDPDQLMADVLAESGIKPPRLYDLGFPHNNCGGFCVKAGLAQFKLLYEKLPARYAYHEAKQEELHAKHPKTRPFLRKRINGKQHYITLKQYREMFLEKSVPLCDDEEFDYGGCGCAL